MAPLIATLATAAAWPDLVVLLKTLALWNARAPPTVYIYTDTAVADKLKGFAYPGTIHTRVVLDAYTGIRRSEMEALPGTKYSSLFFDFVMEKVELLNWAFATGGPLPADGVLFLDADICMMGPLMSAPAEPAEVGLCPHMIRPRDEERFGKYNAGMMWFRSPRAVAVWGEACRTSRFFEQAALEVFDSEEWVGSGRAVTMPIQDDYGWWRMSQGRVPVTEARAVWSIRRSPEHSGLLVAGQPVRSIHTHWHRSGISERAVAEFNEFVLGMLRKLERGHPPAAALLRILSAAISEAARSAEAPA